MRQSLDLNPTFRLNPILATLLSLAVAAGLMGALLIIGIGYRDSRLGLFLLAGLIGAATAVAMFVRPELGIYAIAVTGFLNVSNVLTGQGLPGINQPLLVLTLVSVVASRVFRRGRSLRLKRVEWLMLAYGGVWLLSSFVARDQAVALERIGEFAKGFVMMLCIVYALESFQSWKRTVWLIIASAALLSAMGTYQVVTNNFDQTFMGFAEVEPDQGKMRLTGPVDDPNFYGQILVATVPLVLYRILDEKKWLLRLAAAGMGALIVFAIISTFSRGAFLAMAVIVGLIVIERRIRLSLLLLLAPATLLFLLVIPQTYVTRLQSLNLLKPDSESSIHGDSSFQGRTSELLSGLLMFAEHPFLGVGVGNYAANYQDYAQRIGLEFRTEAREAHSLYVETAAETGLLGLITFAGLYVSLFTGLKRARLRAKAWVPDHYWPTWVISLQMGVAAYLISSIFLHDSFIRYLWLLIALGAAAIHLTDNLRAGAPKQHQKRGLSSV